MKLRDAIQRIALEFPSYGWPRMTAELRRRGWAVNHKRLNQIYGVAIILRNIFDRVVSSEYIAERLVNRCVEPAFHKSV